MLNSMVLITLTTATSHPTISGMAKYHPLQAVPKKMSNGAPPGQAGKPGMQHEQMVNWMQKLGTG